MKNILNIAHRGDSGDFPENTMIAFKKALENGADGIELDVQLSKDLELVVIHDETLDRTTDGCGYVKDYTYEELLKFDAGYKFSKEFKGERIPKLEDVLKLFVNNDFILNIELKNSIINYEGLEEKVYKLIEKYNLEDRVVVSSFNHYSIKKCMDINNKVKVGALVDSCIYEPQDYINSIGADCYHPEFNSLNKEVVKKLKDKKIKINTYTVNKEKDLKNMIDLKVDMIITNYPKKLKELLEM